VRNGLDHHHNAGEIREMKAAIVNNAPKCEISQFSESD